MMLSVNELQSTLLKAGRGAGLPLGLAEDLSWAAREIACGDTDAILRQVLVCLESPMPPAQADMTGQGVIMGRGNTLLVVPSALDLVTAGNGPVILQTDHPALTSALIAARERLVGRALWCDWIHSGKAILHGWNANPAERGTQPQRVTVADPIWAGLQSWAAKTYVPESETSRLAGAGAGLTDND